MKTIFKLLFLLTIAFTSMGQVGGTGGSRTGASVFTTSSNKVGKTITQTAHGFTKCDLVYFDGTKFQKAQADSLISSKVIGMVSDVTNATTFELVTSGYVAGCPGLAVGTDYYLSATTAGAYTATKPIAPNQEVLVFKAISNTELIIGALGGGSGISAATFQSLSTSGNVTAWNSIVNVSALSSNVTLNLPSMLGMTGRTITVVRTDTSSTRTVTIVANGTDTIVNPLLTNTLTRQGQYLTYQAVANTKADVINGVYSPEPTVQRLNATGAVSSWHSIVEIGKTPLTANVVITLPANKSSTIGKFITFKRLDNTAFSVSLVQAGTDTLQLNGSGTELNNQYGAITVASVSAKRAVQVSNIGTNSVVFESVPAVYATGTVSPTNAQNTSGTSVQFLAINIPTAGTWEIEWSVLGQIWNGNSAGTPGNLSSGLFDNTGVLLANSELSSGGGNIGGALASFFLVQGTRSFVVTTTGPTTYNVKVWDPSTNGRATAGNTTSGRSYVTAKKIGGFLPIVGTIGSYGYTKQTTTQAAPSANTPLLFHTIDGDLSLTTNNTITLQAGKIYSLKGAGAAMNGTSGRYGVQFYNVTTGQFIGTTAYYTSPLNNAGNTYVSGVATAIVSANVATNIQLRVTNVTNGGVIGGTGLIQTGGAGALNDPNSSSFIEAVQIGSTATLANQSLNVGNLASGGPLQAGTVDPYVLGYNVAQTTSGQSMSIPAPTSTTINRVIYINNTGTVSFDVLGFTVSAGQTQAFIWNGLAWSNFTNNTVQNVLTESNVVLIPTTTTASTVYVDIPGSNITLPSAGTYRIQYNVSATNNTGAALTGIQLVDASGTYVPGTANGGKEDAGGTFSYPITNVAIVTIPSATTYRLQWKVSAGTSTLHQSAANGGSRIEYIKLGAFLPVNGVLNDNVLTGLTATTVPAVGNAMSLINKVGSNLSVASNQVVLSGGTTGKSFKMLATIARMNGGSGNGEIAYQFRDVTNNVYLGNEGTVTQNTVLGAGSTAIGEVIVSAGQTKTIQLWVTKNSNAGTLSLNGSSATGGAGSFYVYQDGASAYNTLNTYVGATALVAGIVGGVPSAAAGDQTKPLLGNGTWSNLPLSNLAGATVANTIANGNLQQNWNWNLSGTNIGLNISESTAQAGGAGATLLRVGTLATSTIKPFTVLVQGNNAIDVTSTGVTTIGNAIGATANVITAGVTGTTAFNQNGAERMRVHSNGLIGINQPAPTSTLHVIGSVAVNTTTTAAAAYTILANDYTVFLTLAGTQTITLPAAGSFVGRRLTLINTAVNFKTVSTYTTRYGNTNTTVYNRKTLELASDGTVWREIGGNNEQVTLLPGTTSATIGGVTFTVTFADPMVLTTSVAATGFFKTDIVQYANGVTFDYWSSAVAGVGGLLQRGGSATGTTRNIGIYSTAYSSNGLGHITANGLDFRITASSAGATSARVVIELIR